MESNLLIDKTQDETRQGEAYASQASAGVFEKHFYVESYGCAMNFETHLNCTSHLVSNSNWMYRYPFLYS